MLSTALTAGAINAALATLLAAAVLAATWAWRNPFVARGMWLAVLLRFLAPPLVLLPVIQVATAPPSEREVARPTSVSHPKSLPPADILPAPLPTATTADPDDSVPLPAFVGTPRPVAPTIVSLPRRANIPPQMCAAILWIAGSTALAVIGLVRIARFHAAVRRAAPAPPKLQRRAAEIATDLAIRRLPHVRLTAGCTPPLVWPLGRRATVLLPAALVASLDDDQLSAILAHELTHLRRRDAWTRWLELAVVAAFWWCPTAWLARRRLQDAEERCCDADALAAFPRWRRAYADALLATIEFLSPPTPRGLLATPMARRGALLGRIEMLTANRSPVRPSRPVRWLLATIAVVLLLSSPAAVAESESDPNAEAPGQASNASDLDAGDLQSYVGEADPNEAAPSSVPADAETRGANPAAPVPTTSDAAPETLGGVVLDGPVTIEWPDGRLVAAQIRLVGKSWVLTPDDPAANLAAEGKATQLRINFLPRDDEPQGEYPDDLGTPQTLSDAQHMLLWDVRLNECLQMSLQHTEEASVSFDDEGRVVVAQKRSSDLDPFDFQNLVQSRLRDVEDAYWELWFAYRDLDANKQGRDDALLIWRRVKKLERAGSAGGEANAEAQARSQYYLFRAQVETALTNVFRVEKRLRFLLGLSSIDGRLIRPSENPVDEEQAFDFDEANGQAIANRLELVRQRAEIQKLQAHLEKLEVSDNQNRDVEMRHTQMVLKREKSELEDMELEVSHQLADAFRDLDLNFGVAQTHRNRLAAARDEVEAVTTLYDVGQISLDRVMDAQSRAADAAQAASRSRADYARAVLRLHLRKGTLLDYYHIELADAAANN